MSLFVARKKQSYLLFYNFYCNFRQVDLYNEYKSVRGSIGLKKQDLLQIDAESSNQVCGSFGVHPDLPILKELYDAKEAIFIAGIGVLSEPVNKQNYEFKTKTELFAHNAGKITKSLRICLRVYPFLWFT